MVNPKYFTLHSSLRNSDQFFHQEFFYLLKMDGLKVTVKNANQRDFQCTSFSLKRGAHGGATVHEKTPFQTVNKNKRFVQALSENKKPM